MKKKHKKDTSTPVPQREKIKAAIDVRSLNWTPKQKEFLSLVEDKNCKIIFVSGPAGTSKTLLAVYCCLQALNAKSVSDIMYIRSAVESSDAKLGYLPGTVEEKLMQYGLPLIDKLEELTSRAQTRELFSDERVEIAPVNFARGQSWNARGVIIDEAQNLTQKELITVLTRLGKFNKCFVLGDPMQSDINGKSGAFEKMMKLFKDDGKENGVYTFEFTEEDIMRSELVKYLVKKFSTLK